jgi:hypothetical protein
MWRISPRSAHHSILELFIAGIDEDGVPLNEPSQLGVPD